MALILTLKQLAVQWNTISRDKLSNEVSDRIEGNSYIVNKKVHNEYLKLNPFVAKKKFINLYSIKYIYIFDISYS